jgi:multiple antibiotic resistance protein
MSLDSVISTFVTLLIVIDPIGLAPIFVGVTEGLPAPARRSVALRACAIAAGVLIGAALAGGALLKWLGISLPAFHISGGLLLFWIAAEMVYGRRSERDNRTTERAVEEHVRHLAAFPLAIPLMAGPGAIAATVLLAGLARDPVTLAALIGVIVAVIVLTLIGFLFATPIKRALGITGNIVLSKVLGLILAALAVQYVIDGVRAVLRG